MLCTRTLILYMCASPDKTFLWVPTDLTLWPWLWCLTDIKKTLTMPISFNSIFYYFDCSHECFWWQILLVGINRFYLVTLTFMFDLLTENFNLGCIFWMVGTNWGLWYFTWVMNDPTTDPNRFDLVTSTLMFDLYIEN
jgi:hypothetical protein